MYNTAISVSIKINPPIANETLLEHYAYELLNWYIGPIATVPLDLIGPISYRAKRTAGHLRLNDVICIVTKTKAHDSVLSY